MTFDHVAIESCDIKRSVDWYVKNIGCEIIHCDETWAMLKTGEIKIALVLKGEHPPHIAFRVDSTIKIPEKNGKIKNHKDGSSYIYGSDPDGNIVEWVAYTESEE